MSEELFQDRWKKQCTEMEIEQTLVKTKTSLQEEDLLHTNAVFLHLFYAMLRFIFLFNLILLLLVDPGLPRRLRATNLLWKGKTQTAINLLQDDVLVADPGTK